MAVRKSNPIKIGFGDIQVGQYYQIGEYELDLEPLYKARSGRFTELHFYAGREGFVVLDKLNATQGTEPPEGYPHPQKEWKPIFKARWDSISVTDVEFTNGDYDTSEFDRYVVTEALSGDGWQVENFEHVNSTEVKLKFYDLARGVTGYITISR